MERVLVVDDELDICVLLSKYLQKFGADTDYALSVPDAITKASNENYTLFIIDLNLSGGSGYDLIEKLRDMELDTKIIMISAHDGEAENAIHHGADYFVAKPLSKNSINKALEHIHFKD